ncbi:MAG: ATP-binding protein [Candidatus Pacearchaeota archaeon]|nr:MAG: ATP-binding protein [Candidatus Pacearchaeota archaeon]
MKTLTILSGKGGVGKSSITASLAVLLAKKHKVIAVDCDVDAPNLALVLGLKHFKEQKKISTNEKARLISMKGINPKKLIEICNFSAISWDSKKKKLIFDRFLCEGCGSCHLLYPKNIKLEKVQNGFINTGKTVYGFNIVSGQLKIGESGSGKIVTEVKNKAEENAKKEKAEIIIVDSSPGIGCPVIASIQGSDYIIAITEPSPAALNDLQRVLQVVEHFRIPYGIIINKYDLNRKFSKKIENFADKYKIPILGKIPYDKKFVEALVNLKPIVVYEKNFEKLFLSILEKLRSKTLMIRE